MVIWVGTAGIVVCCLLAAALAVAEVRRSYRIVRRAQRMDALGRSVDEVFS